MVILKNEEYELLILYKEMATKNSELCTRALELAKKYKDERDTYKKLYEEK